MQVYYVSAESKGCVKMREGIGKNARSNAVLTPETELLHSVRR